MGMDTTLHFLCGKMASGKSTLAAELESTYNAILLCEDNWLIELYPDEIVDITGYLEYSARLKNVVSDHVKSLLSRGVSVVLDFPGNTENQRKWFRSIYESVKVSHVLHFIDASDELCLHQLKQRSEDKSAGTAFTSEKEFYEITKYFQAPFENEGYNVIRYKKGIL